MRFMVLFALLVVSMGVIGCSRTESTDARLKRLLPDASPTTKVQGKILVDGKPVEKLWVTLHSTGAAQAIKPRGQTDAAGNFKIMTYIAGDGAPKGDYSITIEWLKLSIRDKDWIGPDKLKNQYNDPATSEFKTTVADKLVDLGTYELKLEGMKGKPEVVKKAPVER